MYCLKDQTKTIIIGIKFQLFLTADQYVALANWKKLYYELLKIKEHVH